MDINQHITSNIVLITGHYGCGKTNLTINLAIALANVGRDVTVVDLDIVNPYFRISDNTTKLARYGIDMIAPTFAGTVLDTPSLGANVRNALVAAANGGTTVLVDIGGDPDGAIALGRYRNIIKETNYQLLYVINQRRYQTSNAAEALEVLDEIQRASGLVATHIVDNTHLKQQTTVATVLDALPFAHDVAKQADAPLSFVTAPIQIAAEVEAAMASLSQPVDVMPVTAYVQTPWE